MPSPLPGMDPWVELPCVFDDLHFALTVGISDALNAVMPPDYYSTISHRVGYRVAAIPSEPDANADTPDVVTKEGNLVPAASAGEHVGEETIEFALELGELRERYVEIWRLREEGNQRVTLLIVLNRDDKQPGESGRLQSLAHQRELLLGKVSFVEIDLLRFGGHATAVPRVVIESRSGPFDYHVVVHSLAVRDSFRVYTRRIGTRLPRVSVPLLPGDGSVDIDLQALADRAYDTGRYERRVKYRAWTPDPALTPEQAAWADELLKAKGI